ncbi:MAG: RNA 2',3'-cyclic phosphodiesterase [Alphaproteobacteria bacterium HGW-Alphaproteobacteria-4]|nr:MAG: RNA 2',3'-cyclic phosphodiesterase [Alphaproteobacteria bacterium HGW-Alphaproteobacteria-4]
MRSFLALPLPPGVTRPLAALVAGLPFARPVPPENMHLTLAFLGERREAEVVAAHEAIATLDAQALPIALCGLDVFGGRHPAGLHIGVADPAPLVALHRRVLARLNGAGVILPRERYTPHVTLLRFRAPLPEPDTARLVRFMAERGGIALPPFIATRMVLFRSFLGAGPPRYDELAHYDLHSSDFNNSG